MACQCGRRLIVFGLVAPRQSAAALVFSASVAIMKKAAQYAKLWTAGVGVAVTTYVGTWTDDPRAIGIPALITAVAVALVPNAKPTE